MGESHGWGTATSPLFAPSTPAAASHPAAPSCTFPPPSPPLPSFPGSRLRNFDASVLRSARTAEAGPDPAQHLDTETDVRGAAPDPSIPVDYCIFCYHGSHILRHDNAALLSRFVSERGALLPRRFTKACATHQRKLATVVKRARWMNLIPFKGKLHPRLRFTSLRPNIAREGAVAGVRPADRAAAAPSAAATSGGVKVDADIFAGLNMPKA
jgi:small subunit ribosomal protein S18